MLRMAALAGVEASVKLHIKRGDDLNARDGGGLTPLMLAASKNQASVCHLLVEAGADPDLRDPLGRDALSIALSASAMGAADILSKFICKPDSITDGQRKDRSGAQEIVTVVSLDEDWDESAGEWEAYKEKAPPEGNSLIADQAVAIHRSISRHVPLDTAENWADLDLVLPEHAKSLSTEIDPPNDLRFLLLRAVREGAVPEESVLRVCNIGEEGYEARERIVRALLLEAGVEADERVEEGDIPFIAEPNEEEEVAVSALLEYADDLDPWRSDPARFYAREIRVGRLLTAEEEVSLGKEMENAVSLASKALARWEAGLDELERAGNTVASGLKDATFYAIPAVEDSVKYSAVIANDFEEEEDIFSENGMNGEFLTGVNTIARLRKAGPGHFPSLEIEIQKLRLSPSFLLRLATIASGDPKAKVFAAAVERYAQARETMTVCNLKLVYNLVKRYKGLGLPLDDLLQEGNIGLMKAVERYDWRRGFKFSTYATWWIRQSASRALADTGRTIRLPVHVNEKLNILRRTITEYESRNGMEPSDKKLSELLSMPLDKVTFLRLNMQDPFCLTDRGYDGISFENTLSDDPENRPDAIAQRVALIETLSSAVEKLDERTIEILTIRFGLDGTDSKTLEETGDRFGLTRERVRQIESKALGKLSHPSRSKSLVPFMYDAPLEKRSANIDERDPCKPKTASKINRSKPDIETIKLSACKENNQLTPIESNPKSLGQNSDVEVANPNRIASQTKTEVLISLAIEMGATIEDNRVMGGGVLIKFPMQRDARIMRLTRKLLMDGFSPHSERVFIK